MLTRIEIDGFKSFASFRLDVPPFLVILGPNASGKSNLFDAIQLLRRLVSLPSLFDAFGEARGEMSELFRRRGDGAAVSSMAFAVELLLEPEVVDPFGAQVDVKHTRIRYELEIDQRTAADGFTRLYVRREEAILLKRSTDAWSTRTPISTSFRKRYVRYQPSSRAKLLETTEKDGHPLFRLAQEGRQGRKRELAAHSAETTVLSSITSAAEFPLLYALRKEIENWRFLQLDPGALRMPSSRQQRAEYLEPNGANLAKVLRRIEQATPDEPALEDISADLAKIIRGFSGVEVREDEAKEQWEVYLTTRDDGKLSARVASDGTLRVLALLATLYDPDHRGLVCFEEPENGIYPQRLRELVKHLRSLVTDPGREHDEHDEPLSQLVMSSHSPLLLLELDRSDIVVMDWVSIPEGGTRASRVSRVRRLQKSDQEKLEVEDVGTVVSEHERLALSAIRVDEAQKLLEA